MILKSYSNKCIIPERSSSFVDLSPVALSNRGTNSSLLLDPTKPLGDLDLCVAGASVIGSK